MQHTKFGLTLQPLVEISRNKKFHPLKCHQSLAKNMKAGGGGGWWWPSATQQKARRLSPSAHISQATFILTWTFNFLTSAPDASRGRARTQSLRLFYVPE